jgi:small subunit ribosomal protein S17
MPKRILQGIVTSAANEKTVTVKVERRLAHPMYKKIVTKSKKYAAHDEKNLYKVGDSVTIQETKPISKSKTWEVVYETASK